MTRDCIKRRLRLLILPSKKEKKTQDPLLLLMWIQIQRGTWEEGTNNRTTQYKKGCESSHPSDKRGIRDTQEPRVTYPRVSSHQDKNMMRETRCTFRKKTSLPFILFHHRVSLFSFVKELYSSHCHSCSCSSWDLSCRVPLLFPISSFIT
jgi:hypothetical protein